MLDSSNAIWDDDEFASWNEIHRDTYKQEMRARYPKADFALVKIYEDMLSSAEGNPSVCGVAIETNSMGLCTYVAPVRVGGSISKALPF